MERLSSYLSEYEGFFKNKTKKFFDKAEKYSHGLFLSDRRNIEKICESTTCPEYYQMQHFITESNWEFSSIIDKAAIETDKVLPNSKLTGLIIDETGCVKKGKKSVGVSHQYCGNVGKIANSQVAVMACLSNGDFASMVDSKLFLPEDWCNDKERCDQAGIPEAERLFKTKLEIAYEIILHQIEMGTQFDYIGADGYYGNDAELADKIEGLGYNYMLDIHADARVFTEKPELKIPERKSSKGRAPKLLKPDKKSIRVDEYYKTLDSTDWAEINVRNTAKGKLKAKYHFAKVYIWNKTRDTIERRLMVIRKTPTKKGIELKFSFTNTNLEQYTEKAIAYMQAQRFFVEHCIKESKQVLGMGQYQTRKWLAWYHQIALNIMIACFILKEKLHCFEDMPLLSAWDIRDWIIFKLYKQLSNNEMLDILYCRHFNRQKDINHSYNKQLISLKG